MNIVDGINKYIANHSGGNNSKNDELAIEFLDTLDYGDETVKQDVYDAVRLILEKTVESNAVLSRVFAKAMHYMIAKVSLTELSYPDAKIIYHDIWNNSGAAFYDRNDVSLNFNSNLVCDDWELLSTSQMVQHRISYFVHEIFEMQHEIQHYVQFDEMGKLANDPSGLNPKNYTMQLQNFARTMAESDNINTQILQAATPKNKYNTKEKSLYHQNHDEFLYELDADVEGVKRVLDITNRISPSLYNQAIDVKHEVYLDKKAKKEKLIKEYNTVEWNHSSNPNNGPVSAAHKTSIIIDSVWGKLDQGNREYWLDKCPALAITRTRDGKKKTLDAVEKERDEKIAEIKANANGEDVKDKIRNTLDIYTAAIEQDAMLSFEKQVQHISRMSFRSPAFFVQPDGSLQINPEGPFFFKSISDIMEELSRSTDKAKKIASYVEDFDSVSIKSILDKYMREAKHPHIQGATVQDMSVFDSRLHALYAIENSLYHNVEFVDGVKTIKQEEREKQEKENQKIEAARSVIQGFFPGFQPNPEIYGVDSGTGVPVIMNNVQEKLKLLSAIDDYLKWLDKNKPENFVPASNVRNAINTLYPFGVTDEEKKEFAEMVKNNPMFAKIPHKYIQDPVSSDNNATDVVADESEDDMTM